MKTHYILIDYENVPVKSLALLKGKPFRVGVFLGPKNTRLATEFVLAMRDLGAQGDYIQIEAAGPNALDFHIAYYLGRLLEARAADSYHIISKDKGFDALVAHVNQTGIACERADSIEAMSCWPKPVPAKAAVAKPAEAAAPAKAAAKPATKMKADQVVKKIVGYLRGLEAGKPKSEKTLKGKIRNWCGAGYSDKEIDAVFSRLVKQGFVTITAGKVGYCLDGDE